MKISPMPAGGMPVPNASLENEQTRPDVRRLRMHTQATPGQSAQISTTADPVESPAVLEATEPLSPQFAALAREKRALQRERQAFEAERAKATSSTQEEMIPKAQLKSNWLRMALDAGLTWDDLTKDVTDYQNGHNAQFHEMENKFKALEESFDKKLTDREAQAEQQALTEIMRDAAQIVAQNDDFEMVRETKSLKHVKALIERTYRENGQLLDTREALKLVEDELLTRAMRLAKAKKVQSQLMPQAPAQTQQSRFRQTLTNRDTASAAPLDRKARAIAAMLGQKT